VVLKFLSSVVLHKSDIGGVHLNLQSAEDLRGAFDLVHASLRRHRVREEGYLVAPFVEGGVEMALGIHHDPEVGPLVMVGAGGVLLELIKDVEFGAVPLAHATAEAMVRRLKSHKLLTGFRDKPPLDVDALCSAMVQLGQLAADCSGLVESIDVNPLVVMPKGCVALDAAIVLKPRSAEHARPAAANG
jgi:succinyl-CoA synthetase beta subunit